MYVVWCVVYCVYAVCMCVMYEYMLCGMYDVCGICGVWYVSHVYDVWCVCVV